MKGTVDPSSKSSITARSPFMGTWRTVAMWIRIGVGRDLRFGMQGPFYDSDACGRERPYAPAIFLSGGRRSQGGDIHGPCCRSLLRGPGRIGGIPEIARANSGILQGIVTVKPCLV